MSHLENIQNQKKIREDNRRHAFSKLDQTRSLNYHFLQTEKSSKTQKKITKIMDERNKDLRFDHFRANLPPKTQVNWLIVISCRQAFHSSRIISSFNTCFTIKIILCK